MIIRILKTLLSAFLLLNAAAAPGETYDQTIQHQFRDLYGVNASGGYRQFAVLTFGDDVTSLAPQPLRKNAPVQVDNSTDPAAGFTYLSYEGLPAVHS